MTCVIVYLMPIKIWVQLSVILFSILYLLLSTFSARADEDHPQPIIPPSTQSPLNIPQAKELTWHRVNLPPMGEVTDIAIDQDDPNWIFLVGDAGGVVVSSDGGKTFRKGQVPKEFDFLLHGKFITISPQNSNYIVADADQGGKVSGASYTTNRGKNWKLLELGEVRGPGDVYDAAFHPTSPNIVYVLKGPDIFLSDLKTEKVTKLFTSPSGTFRTVNVSPDNPNIILLGGQTGGGFGGLPLGRSDSPGFGSAGTILYKSTDGGKNWQQVKTDIGSVSEFAFDKNRPGIIFAATTKGVFKSTNSGDNWTKIEHNFSSRGAESIVASADGSLVVVGTRTGAWVSYDLGETWQATNHAKSKREQFVDSVAIDSQNKIYLGTTNGLFRSTDSGKTFAKLEGLYNYDILLLTIDPYDPDIIFTGTRCARGIHKSLDGGKTWRWSGGNDFTQEFLTGLLNHYQMDIDVASSNPNIVWTTTAEGVYKSEDGGFTWKVIDNDLTRIPMAGFAHLPWWHLHGMGIHPKDPNIVIVGNGTGGLAEKPGPKETFLLKTADGGKNWQKIVLSKEILSSIQDVVFNPSDPNIIYVPTHTEDWDRRTPQKAQGLFKSTDGGKTFSKTKGVGMHGEEISAFAISQKTPNKIFAMGHREEHRGSSQEAAAIHVSSDGGENWSLITLPVNEGQVARHNGLVIDPTDDNHIFVATSNGVLESKDGGKSWQLEGLGIDFSGIARYLNLDRYGSTLYLVLEGKEGPAIYHAKIRDVQAQTPPVKRIEKSEDEQFTQSFGNIFTKVQSVGIPKIFIFAFAAIGIFVLGAVIFLVYSLVKRIFHRSTI